ncbi:penicillin-binding transpeptidase domain-containing protein [Stackebrandtia soli]|uniref:penicillin-binding transpeptidase domain-containing protein n=1 Tax=Stackebrandtia soli TaxID=1892856 RepID=UPI0039ECC3DE
MNTPLRRVTIVLIALFSVMFVNLNWIQFVEHDYYKNNDYNNRITIDEYSRPRGSILAGSETLARSVETDGDLKYAREYPGGPAFAHLTGYQSLVIGDGGIESVENDLLSGEDPRLFVDRINEMFTGNRVAGGNVILSVDPALQKAAWETLSARADGKVATAVMIDPRSGQILSQVSTPSYDPTPLASHDIAEVQGAWTELNAEGSGNPMLDRSTNEVFPPGSTMKIVTAAAALAAGMTPDTMVESGNEYTPPNTTQVIRNSNNQCPEKELPLKEAFARSCNTTFAKLCVNDFGGLVDDGATAFSEMAEAFGFGEELRTPLKVSSSRVGDVSDPAFLAQACFGQHEARQTTLQNAMIAATIANGGERMQPQLIKELQAPDQTTLERVGEESLGSPVSGDVAEGLREMMELVVTDGTGGNAAIDGFTVGGKTGTAEHGVDSAGNPLPEHGWFTGYAFNGDGDPVVAITVFLADAGDGGSGDATAIAGDLMRLALET